MTTLVFTGSAGEGVQLAAAAAALREAGAGHRTLLLSLDPPPLLGALLGVPVSVAPAAVVPHLDALALDAPAALGESWNEARAGFPSQLAQIAGDELPLLPGMGTLFGLARLIELAPRYERVVVDAGAHGELVQALGLADGLRWVVRLFFGLDRDPGRSPASQARALLPLSFIPLESIDRVQQARVEAERTRAALIDAARAVYVLRPDAAALAEARLAIPALQLNGLAVAALAAGPLLPAGTSGPAEAMLVRQERAVAEAAPVWPTRPLLRLDHQGAEGLDGLRELGRSLGDLFALPFAPPISESYKGEPALAVELSGLPQGALQLTLSGDELIIRLGPYRRNVLLPEQLRGITTIRATREGPLLVVRRRG
jgi:anion-transporting  ArsA/GET3 family ATPase